MTILPVDGASPDARAFAAALEVLHAGGIAAYPTDTLYALAVDPRRDAAVERLFQVKGRAADIAIPLIAGSVEQAARAGRLGKPELRLAAALWPGPLTLVVPAVDALSRRVLAGGTTVAIRVPAHPVARALAAAFGFCITATSANISGQRPAITADNVVAALDDRIDVIVDGGPAPGGLPSTIMEITTGGPRLIRAGAIAWKRVLESL